MERDMKRRGVNIWLFGSVVVLMGLACLMLVARFEVKKALQHLNMRIFVDSMQDVAEELIEINAIEDLRKFNRELGLALLEANQGLSTAEFWKKWNERVRVVKGSKATIQHEGEGADPRR